MQAIRLSIAKAALLLVALLAYVGSRSAEAQEVVNAWRKPQQQEAPTRLIVKYRDDLVSASSVDATVSSIRSHASFKSEKKMLIRNAYVVEAKTAAGARRLRRDILQQQRGQVEYVEYDRKVYALGMPTECGTSSQCVDSAKYWGLKKIKADFVWSRMNFGGTRIMGGIIDTGIDYDHSELAGQVDISSSTSCMTGYNTCSTASPTINGKDDEGHGTHCAGIMAARHSSGSGTPVGVATSAKLLSCKFLGADGSGYISGAADCIMHLVNKGVKVISNSWGGDGTASILTSAFKSACAANVLNLVAAGNEAVNVNRGTDGSGSYPANYAGQPGLECIITVAATDSNDRLTSFSNYGSNVMLAAPGYSIYSTVRAANGGYAYMSGTSMATPFVSGAALALWNTFPSLTMTQVKDILINSATVAPTPYWSGAGISGKILDVQAAVGRAQLLNTDVTPSPSPSPSPAPVNCEGYYTAWSNCSQPCGPGTQTRTYIITTPAANGGTDCPASTETQSCDLGACGSDCVGGFTDWTACDKSCGGGNQNRTYVVSAPATGSGAACPYVNGYTESRVCNTDACSADCSGGFGDWSPCSKPCGGGTQTRTYTISNPATGSGAQCPFPTGHTETQDCNTTPCPVDCVGNFSAWSACSVPCGGGTQTRTFLVTQHAANGGKECTPAANTVETQSCNTQACTPMPPVPPPQPSPSPSPPPALTCRNNNQCNVRRMKKQMPAGAAPDCFASGCYDGYCSVTAKAAGSRCSGGYCDGSGFCKACLTQDSARTCPASSPVCLLDASGAEQCGCSGDASCPASAPYCKDGKQCVQCYDNSGCASQSVNKVCNTQTNMCVQCLTDTHCNGNPSGTKCSTKYKTCGCTQSSHCPSLPNPVPSGFDAQCLTPTCIPSQMTCSAAVNANKACTVAGGRGKGYCSVTYRGFAARGATCSACKAARASCSVGTECCSGSCRSRRCA